ncbi:MAG: hypothetical protein EP315_02685 [Gammaproteobacteria bacterium]|nr:MAG: hypothetical protein EP315_02685 [Gammaproteobacteria bacterium]
MAKHTVKVTGLAWFKREHYARLKKLFSDGRKFPDTYDKWLKKSTRSLEQKQTEGVFVEKVIIEPEAFAGWCQQHHQKPDAAARYAYVNDCLSGKYQTQA